jgi:hypothetical protein
MWRKRLLALSFGGLLIASVGVASAQLPVTTALISQTAADWGGSNYSGSITQIGWGGWGGFTSGGNGADTQGNTVTYQPPPGIDTDGSVINGLINFDDNFGVGTGTPYTGMTSNPGSATINAYPGGFDRLVSSELAPSGTGSQNTALFTALTTGSMFALDFTSPLGGTTLAPAGSSGFFDIGVEILAGSSTKLTAAQEDSQFVTSMAAGFTQSSPDPGNFGEDKGAYLVNNGTYFTAYLPYTYAFLASAADYSTFKLAIVLNTDGSDAYGSANGNVTVDNLRLVAPVPEPASIGLLGLSIGALALRRRRIA